MSMQNKILDEKAIDCKFLMYLFIVYIKISVPVCVFIIYGIFIRLFLSSKAIIMVFASDIYPPLISVCVFAYLHLFEPVFTF